MPVLHARSCAHARAGLAPPFAAGAAERRQPQAHQGASPSELVGCTEWSSSGAEVPCRPGRRPGLELRTSTPVPMARPEVLLLPGGQQYRTSGLRAQHCRP